MPTATVPRLTSVEVIAALREERGLELAAAANQLALALAWAQLHPWGDGEAAAGWGDVDLHGEQTVRLAGPGAPEVAEFAPLELAAALGLPADAGRRLLADALELAYRLPRLWALVLEHRVPAWRARQIAAQTTDLSRDAAAYADRLVAADPTHLGAVHATRLVDEARLWFDPDRAGADEQAALSRRGVWLHAGTTAATTEVTMTLDTRDAHRLDTTIAGVAGQLAALGDTDHLEVRRARAVGVLADPQLALDLLSGRRRERTPDPNAGATLYLHVTTDDLSGDAGGVVEGLGPATLGLLATWLRDCGPLTIRPVLNLGRADAVDAHDPPAWLRELVVQRDATCIFPHCSRGSRSCDLDHISPYLSVDRGGGPGQTQAANLAPLCRTHHRAKTHGRWSYLRRRDGTYEWTSPTGTTYLASSPSRRPGAPIPH